MVMHFFRTLPQLGQANTCQPCQLPFCDCDQTIFIHSTVLTDIHCGIEHFVKAVEEKSCDEAFRGQFRIFNDGNSYTYVPLRLDTFIKALSRIKEDYYKLKGENAAKPSFVDAGCGLGIKLIIAEGMGFNVTGIEIDHKIIKRAEEIFYPHRLNIECQDILEHDYSKYDVIYFYCPFHNRKKQAEFEQRIHSQMKPGAYSMGFWSKSAPPDENQFDRLFLDPYLFYRRK